MADEAPEPEDPIGAKYRRSVTAKRAEKRRRLAHASTSDLNFASAR